MTWVALPSGWRSLDEWKIALSGLHKWLTDCICYCHLSTSSTGAEWRGRFFFVRMNGTDRAEIHSQSKFFLLLQIQTNFENISLLSEFIPPEDDLSLSYMITVKSARSYSLCHLWWGSLGIIGSTKQISSYLRLHLASHEDTLFWTGRGKKYFFGQGGEETVNFVIYGASPELHSQAFWGSKFEATGKFSICIALMGTSAFCQNFWGSKFEGTGTLASCNFLSEKL